MSNETATKATRTRIVADWGTMNLFDQFILKTGYEKSPGAGVSGKNLKVQGAYTLTGVQGRRVFNQAKADNRVIVNEAAATEITTVDFNSLMRDLLDAYSLGKIELPVVSEESSEGDEA